MKYTIGDIQHILQEQVKSQKHAEVARIYIYIYIVCGSAKSLRMQPNITNRRNIDTNKKHILMQISVLHNDVVFVVMCAY